MLTHPIVILFFLQFFLIDGVAGDLRVTLSVFSGRSDPEWTVRSSDMSQTVIKQLLDNARNKGFAYSLQQMPARLGYRGFLVQDTRRTNEELLVGPETKKLQQLLLSTIPNSLLPSGNLREIGREIASGKVKAVAVGKRIRRYAPPYDPASWNIVDPIVRKRVCNNCYNYANRRPTNTRAQPGYGGGQQYTQHTNQDLIAAAIRDGLVIRPYQPAGPNDTGPVPPNDHRHLVALAVDPDQPNANYIGDHHWYRLDDNGRWSHKPGMMFVTQKDNADQFITNPAAPNADLGRYRFVCFMISDPLHVNIGSAWRCPAYLGK